MHIATFTERPYAPVPEDEVIRNASFFGVSNRFLDPVKAGALFNRYLDESSTPRSSASMASCSTSTTPTPSPWVR